MSTYQERETPDILQSNARALSHGMQRVVGNVELDTNLVSQTLVESSQQRSATRKINPVTHNVGIQFRRSILKRIEHSCLDFGN